MDDELTPEQEAELDKLLAQRTSWLEAATAQLRHQVAQIKAETAHRETALLEAWWRLES